MGTHIKLKKALAVFLYGGLKEKLFSFLHRACFWGVGSELILPDADQKCRIWDSSSLGSIEGLTAPSQSQSPQQSSGCEDGHWIQSIAGNGEIIKLEDGSIWQVDAVDTVTSSIWLPVSNVTICGSYLINTDDGEKVSATRLK
ncbi:hypothetical protein DIY08_01745 [Shewanella xiamenensis]|nr:hypothetical protein DIY08_01745 [Shewanella xiamenensis]